MRYVYRILELITLIVCFGCCIVATTGKNTDLIVGVFACLSGVWVVVAALATLENNKIKSKIHKDEKR